MSEETAKNFRTQIKELASQGEKNEVHESSVFHNSEGAMRDNPIGEKILGVVKDAKARGDFLKTMGVMTQKIGDAIKNQREDR